MSNAPFRAERRSTRAEAVGVLRNLNCAGKQTDGLVACQAVIPESGGATLDEWLERAKGSVALVFADIMASTVLLNSKGTENYSVILSALRSRAEQLATSLGGRIVSYEGDQIFAAFFTVCQAYRFAQELFRDAGHPLLEVRLGVHFGRVQVLGSGMVGRSVHLAARVVDHGRGHEIWISDVAKRALEADSASAEMDISWILSEECQLDGVPETQLLWRAA